MLSMTSIGRKEIGASALRRYFNSWMDSSKDLILASMACRWCSRESAWLGSMMFATNMRLAQLFDTMVSHGHLIGESEKEKNGSGSKTRN